MRSHWEEGAKDDLDAPVVVTEREMRGLRRRARAGVIAFLFSLLSTAAVAWSMYMGPEGFEKVQDLKAKILEATGNEAPAAATQSPTQGPKGASPATATSPGANSTQGVVGPAAPGAPGAPANPQDLRARVDGLEMKMRQLDEKMTTMTRH